MTLHFSSLTQGCLFSNIWTAFEIVTIISFNFLPRIDLDTKGSQGRSKTENISPVCLPGTSTALPGATSKIENKLGSFPMMSYLLAELRINEEIAMVSSWSHNGRVPKKLKHKNVEVEMMMEL